MKKKYFIVIVILIVLLTILNLSLILESNNEVKTKDIKIECVNQIDEYNSTNNLLVESIQEETVISDNITVPNTEVLQEDNSISLEVEKEQSSNSKTKDTKEVKKEKAKQNKTNSSSSTSNNSQTSSTQQWKTETHYGGEIPDSSGYNGGYWMQGQELDLSGIDMSDWSIK